MRWPTVTDSPMVRGADPFRSVLSLSTDDRTVNTNTNVIITSTPNPWPPDTLLRPFSPRPPRVASGVTPYKMPEPAIAPNDWAMMYRMHRAIEIFLVIVAPLTWKFSKECKLSINNNNNIKRRILFLILSLTGDGQQSTKNATNSRTRLYQIRGQSAHYVLIPEPLKIFSNINTKGSKTFLYI